MRRGKDIHLVVPVYLLDQIAGRAMVSGRSLNAEHRYLLGRGLELAAAEDVTVEMPRGVACKRAVVSPIHDVWETVVDRSARFDRSVGAEALRLIVHAIQASADVNQAAMRSARVEG